MGNNYGNLGLIHIQHGSVDLSASVVISNSDALVPEVAIRLSTFLPRDIHTLVSPHSLVVSPQGLGLHR